MPGDFQVICGSMVSENHWSPASTETPVEKIARPISVDDIYCMGHWIKENERKNTNIFSLC